jgi:outer membrane protein TolC
MGGPLAAQQSALDAYVAEGLSRNLRLQSERVARQATQAGVREARGRWLPSLTLTARYSERSGRALDLGDLVNPAYAGLNQILGSNAFPTDVSLKLPFKQETGLRLLQPLFQPAIAAGVAIARSADQLQAATTAAGVRGLAARIRLAYIDYVTAARVEQLSRATLALLQENLRVTQSLVGNGAATPDAALRAKADLSEGEQRLAESIRARDAAREAFNLLLERPMEGEVQLADDSALGIADPVPLDSAIAHGLVTREEPRALTAAIRVAEGRKRLATAAFYPSLSAAVDYGFQGDRYRFAGDRDLLVASLALSWNLFNGGQDQARRQEAELQRERLRLERAATARAVELEIRTAWRAAEVARQAIETAAARLESAERSYALVERKYRAGTAPQVELIDARTSYTAARLNRILTTYDYYARCVELERAAALYPGPALGGEP